MKTTRKALILPIFVLVLALASPLAAQSRGLEAITAEYMKPALLKLDLHPEVRTRGAHNMKVIWQRAATAR